MLSLDVKFAFSGHGEFIEDMAGLVRGYQEHHERRKDQIEDSLTAREISIYALVEEFYPGIPETEIFLAVSEIFSHLEVLMNEGRVKKAVSGPPALFTAVS